MKKVLLILILFLSCYFIYNQTSDNKLYYLTIGDSLSRGTNEYGIVTYGYNDYVKDYLEENNKLEGFNKTFTDNDYRIIDIIKILRHNKLYHWCAYKETLVMNWRTPIRKYRNANVVIYLKYIMMYL